MPERNESNPRSLTAKQDREKIKKLLDQKGIKELVEEFETKLAKEKGTRLLCGITTLGQIVVVIEEFKHPTMKYIFGSSHFKVFVLNVSPPLKKTKEKPLEAIILKNHVDTLDSGARIFPGKDFEKNFSLLQTNPTATFASSRSRNTPPSALSTIEFYKQTGGFRIPGPEEGGLPTLGKDKQPLYPNPLKGF